jgi:hypothetical protein
MIALAINFIILFWYEYKPVPQSDGTQVIKAVIDEWADNTIEILGIA